jgi:hypothetical protein
MKTVNMKRYWKAYLIFLISVLPVCFIETLLERMEIIKFPEWFNYPFGIVVFLIIYICPFSKPKITNQ